jgi:hypothetical protein
MSGWLYNGNSLTSEQRLKGVILVYSIGRFKLIGMSGRPEFIVHVTCLNPYVISYRVDISHRLNTFSPLEQAL